MSFTILVFGVFTTVVLVLLVVVPWSFNKYSHCVPLNWEYGIICWWLPCWTIKPKLFLPIISLSPLNMYPSLVGVVTPAAYDANVGFTPASFACDNWEADNSLFLI